MAEAITPITPAAGSFDTASMQIARAQARAIAANSNQEAFLREIAKTNEETNARTLTSTTETQPSDPFFNSGLPEEEPTTDPTDPSNEPSPLSIFGAGIDVTNPPPEISQAQQLHDIAILQKDAEMLEEAANTNTPLPLTSAASTLDLSLEAQDLLSGTSSFTSAQLSQIGNVLQPVANQTLTPELLQRIQAQLAADQNPIKLSLATIALAMNYVAGAQLGHTHAANSAMLSEANKSIVPVTAIDKVAVEDSAIR